MKTNVNIAVTAKEREVLNIILNNEFNEEGKFDYPVWTQIVKDYATFKGKTFSGVVSNLVQKDLITVDSSDEDKAMHTMSVNKSAAKFVKLPIPASKPAPVKVKIEKGNGKATKDAASIKKEIEKVAKDLHFIPQKPAPKVEKTPQKVKKPTKPAKEEEPKKVTPYGLAVEIMCSDTSISFEDLKKAVYKELKGVDGDSAIRTAYSAVRKITSLLQSNGWKATKKS